MSFLCRYIHGHRVLCAAARGDAAAVTSLLHGTSAVELRRRADHFAMCSVAAARGGFVDVLIALSAAGVDLERAAPGPLGATPAIAAASAGHGTALEMLVELGINVSARASGSGVTPAIVAARRGDDQVLAALARCGADLDVQSARGGASPTFVAAFEGHTRCIVVLVLSGANVNAPRRCDGATPLHVAAQSGFADTAQLLMNAGADVNDGERTPLFLAALGGHVETVDLLLRAGANADGRSAHCGALLSAVGGCAKEIGGAALRLTPLAIAARRGDAAMVKALLRRGAGVNVPCSADDGAPPPIVVAAYHGHCDVLRALAAAPGVRLDRTDRDGRTAAVHCKQRHGLALRAVLLNASVQASVSSALLDTSAAASTTCGATLLLLWQRCASWGCSWLDALRGRSFPSLPPPSRQATMRSMRCALSEGLYGPGMLLGCGVGLGCGCCAPAEVESPRAGAAEGTAVGGAADGAATTRANAKERRPAGAAGFGVLGEGIRRRRAPAQRGSAAGVADNATVQTDIRGALAPHDALFISI